MYLKSNPKGHIIRFEQGEEVISGLKQFAKEKRISAAHFVGIGMFREVELAFFNPEWRKYENTTISEDLEVVSFSGNISLYKDDVHIHAHGSFGRKDFSVIGGHIASAVIGMTLEIIVTDLETRLDRFDDPDLGLKLLEV
jgi:uncharacterized protein